MTPQETKPPVIWTTRLIFGLTFLVALVGVPWYGLAYGYDLVEWLTAIVMLAFCGFSITAGYHRLWSHKTYEAHPVVRAFWAFWGACALQNSILIWASGHRRHHRYVDDNEKDPYSIGRGFWFAHMGWMLRRYPSGDLDLANAGDLQRDPIVMFQHRHYAALVLISNVGLPVFLGYLNGDILGMLLLAGFLRLVISHHVTFFINSLCHMWGSQPYTDTNSARDNPVLALVTYGEGYHNFHHYFQADYRNGVRWWQFDPTKWLIFSLSWLRLASNLKRTPDFKIQEAILQMQFQRARQKLEAPKVKNPEVWQVALETEYALYMQTLNEWKAVRLEWLEKTRQAFAENLAEKKQELQDKIQLATLKSRMQEMEYGLKLQRRRLQAFLGSMTQA